MIVQPAPEICPGIIIVAGKPFIRCLLYTSPENVQLIGLVADIEGEEDTKPLQMARDYLTAAEADFTNMMVNRDFDRIMNWVTGVPTTIFVDKSGNIVGEPIVGANVEGYKAFVEEYLNEQ